jgi:hypothetical protein
VTATAAARRRGRLFVRLLHLSRGRLMDAALGSREIAAEHFVIWGGALLATPTLLYTVRTTSAYPFLRWRSLESLQMVALGDRLFFIVWAMLVAMLLVSLLWEGLYPDRTDQQLLGVLPVSARMVAAARVATALGAALVLLTAIVVPTAVFYAATSGVHPVLGARLGVMVGQIVGGVGGGLLVFTTLMTVRGLLVYVLGAGAAARAAVALQVMTVLLLVETFLFLPGILPGVLRPLMTPGAAEVTWMAPAWFLGLSVWVAGPHRNLLGVMAGDAVAAVLAVVVLAVVVYVAPAPAIARRALETRITSLPRGVGPRLTALASRLVFRRSSRALLVFTLRSFARSPRHQIAIASWLGLALGVGGVRLMAAQVRGRPLALDVPADYLVALPLVLTFFLIGGLRAAFALPTDVQANWTFRLTASHAPASCIGAVRAALWLLAVMPVSALVALAGGWLWGWGPALAVAAMHAVSGVALCEAAVLDCESIPFTRQRGLSTGSLKIGAPLGLVALILYAFTLDDLQLLALRAADGVWWYTGIGLLITGGIGVFGQRRARPPIPCFDAPTEEMTALSLSGARG